MKLCILVEDKHVEEVREIALEEFPAMKKHKGVLQIPVSSSGELPVTHWACSMVGHRTRLENILAKANLSEMEEGVSLKKFLRNRELKICPRSKK